MTPAQQLDGFLKKYDPAVARLAKAAFARARRLFPGATALVYDNHNALAIGFGPNERASEAAFSIAVYPRWVRLFFLRGATLPDPHRRLEGNAKQVRSVRLDRVEVIDEPPILELLALAAARHEIPVSPRGPIVIKSVSKVQRPRSPAHQRTDSPASRRGATPSKARARP